MGLWMDAGWVPGTFSRQDSLMNTIVQEHCSSVQQISTMILYYALGTQMNKIPFLPVRSSWPNRKIDVTAVVQRVKCYYKDKNQKN